MKFSIKDLFSKCDLIRCFLWIWSHLLKKFLMENFIFYAVDTGIWIFNEACVASILQMYLPCVLLCINIVFYFKCFCFQIVFAKGAHYAIKKLSETQYDVIALDWTVNRKQARYDMATHVQILSTFCVDFVVVVGSRFFFMESSRCLLKADTISHEKVNSF